jgi:probable HAF family extracellular repeat protein
MSYASLSYQLVDLGEFFGTNESYAYGINSGGNVVGSWNTGTNGFHGFLYNGTSIEDLGRLGELNNYALNINARGDVVGFSQESNGTHAFLFRNGDRVALSAFDGMNSYGFGINGISDIVGAVETTGGTEAILLHDGQMVKLGTLGGTNSYAYDINLVMQIAGASLTPTNTEMNAFLWQEGRLSNLNDLIEPGSQWSLREARCINESGEIAGWGLLNGTERGFMFKSGDVIDLGILPGGTNSYALGINNSNEIVGASSTASGLHGFLWEGGKIRDLNALAPLAPDWELVEALGINDSGQIAGWGYFHGQGHAFLLNPLLSEEATKLTAVQKETGDESKSRAQPLLDSPPTVSITSPTNNAAFSTPTNITISVSATGNGGTITQVQVFAGAKLLGTV